MKIAILDIIGSRCITKEDGQIIYESINELLRNGEKVTLDFLGVNQFASPFFNYAIGQLLSDIKEEELRELLKIENLDSTGELVITRVIENASRYHNDIDYSKIVDDILEKHAEESD